MAGPILRIVTVLLAGGAASAAVAQTVPGARTAAVKDACTITAHANDIVRIEMVRLGNGFYSHRAFGERGRLVCDGEWSATYELNREAAEILRYKGNNRATIVDRVRGQS